MDDSDRCILMNLNDALNDINKVEESIRRAKLAMGTPGEGYNIALDTIENTLPIIQKLVYTMLNFLNSQMNIKSKLPDTDFVSSST